MVRISNFAALGEAMNGSAKPENQQPAKMVRSEGRCKQDIDCKESRYSAGKGHQLSELCKDITGYL